MLKNIKILIIPTIIITLFSCFMPEDVSDNSTKIELSDDKNIDLFEEGDPLEIEEESDDTEKSRSSRANTSDVDIYYRAKISPVYVNGLYVQSNDIVISGSTAYIAYNYADDEYRGAIQIVDISNTGYPRIETEIKFYNMDINTLEIDGNNLLFGGQGNEELYGYTSFVGSIDLSSSITSTKIKDSIVGLDSYAATGIAKKGSSYYVGVGAKDGKLVVLDSDLNETASYDVDDIRDVDTYKNGIVLISGTTDNDNTTGKISFYPANDMENPIEKDIDDFNSDYHKSTIEMYDSNYALLGLSEAGFQIVEISDDDTPEIILNIANPTSSSTDNTNTNSVSYDDSKDYIFTANGEYGFRVFDADKNDLDGTEVVGYYSFRNLKSSDGTQYSANHIEFKSNHLFVAAGSGGVLIYCFKE